MVGYGIEAPEDPPSEGETVTVHMTRGESDFSFEADVRRSEPSPTGDGYVVHVYRGIPHMNTYMVDTASGEITVGGENSGVLRKLETEAGGEEQ